VTKSRAAALAALSFALLAGCGEKEGGPVSAESFDAELPSGWTEGDDDDLETATQAAVQGAASILGVDPDELNLEAQAVWLDSEAEGDDNTNINVLAEEIPPDVGEDGYIEASLGTIDELPGVEDFEELGDTEVDGDTGEGIAYTAAPSGAALRFRAVAVVHDGEGFNITLTAAEDEFDSASEDLDEILASWQWTD
jgi:hypothetical protein